MRPEGGTEGSRSPATPAGKPEVVVKLGHVAPMTGPQAHLGKDNENGAASPSRS
jgi:ABC-type branched-subunit amino acid transport system substrate-binding protein